MREFSQFLYELYLVQSFINKIQIKKKTVATTLAKNCQNNH